MAPLVGRLLQATTDRHHPLTARTLIGRSRRCDLVVPHASISGEHALIWWDGERWSIRDLGSRNGTLVDGHRLDDAPRVLELDARVQLGAHPLAWTVDCLAPPRARAVALDDPERPAIEAEDGVLALPDERVAELVIYGSATAGWVLEAGERARPVEDREVIEVAGTRYRLELPQLLGETADLDSVPPRLAELTLRFRVSSDEEHVSLEGLLGQPPTQRSLALGPRAHHYTLLTLARARLADAELPEPERGWVYRDQLQAQLQLDREQLNMLVFRARKQLAAAGIENAHELVERRPDTHQLRLGIGRVEILGG